MFNWFRKPKVDRPAQVAKKTAVSPDERFHNPVDGKTYVAPGGWQTHEPKTLRQGEPTHKVRTVQVRLLTSEGDIAARTTVAELAAFVLEAEQLAEASFGKSARQFRVMAQFACTPAGHELNLAHQGDAPQELLQTYYVAVTAAKKLPVHGGEVTFQLELSVNSYARRMQRQGRTCLNSSRMSFAPNSQ